MADREGLIPGTNIKWRLRHVADFEQNPTNPVAHSKANLDLVTKSIKRFGALRSGVSSHGKLLAGNLTQRGMIEAGIQDVLEISGDGSIWTVVERDDLSETEQQMAAYYDQQASFQATWDADQVAADIGQEALTASLRDELFLPNELAMFTYKKTDSTPPSLDSLADIYGEPQQSDFWPVIGIKVPPELYNRFMGMLRRAQGETDVERLEALLDSVSEEKLEGSKSS